MVAALRTEGLAKSCGRLMALRPLDLEVAEKWLKDRRGRIFSRQEIAHYQKMVASIDATRHIMGEIDAVIDAHGGWPGAFVRSSSS
jgi:hypothetical protein